jgi:hypothetical protein
MLTTSSTQRGMNKAPAAPAMFDASRDTRCNSWGFVVNVGLSRTEARLPIQGDTFFGIAVALRVASRRVENFGST